MIELFVEKRIGALEYGMFAHAHEVEVYAEYYVRGNSNNLKMLMLNE